MTLSQVLSKRSQISAPPKAGVRTVDVDLPSGLVTIASDAPLADASVAAAVDEAGYEVVVLDEGVEKQISGADVREALREDGDWEALVPAGVARVIRSGSADRVTA